MIKNISIVILALASICLGYLFYDLKNKENLEIENLEHQIEYERTMNSIDSTQQANEIKNLEKMILILK